MKKVRWSIQLTIDGEPKMDWCSPPAAAIQQLNVPREPVSKCEGEHTWYTVSVCFCKACGEVAK